MSYYFQRKQLYWLWDYKFVYLYFISNAGNLLIDKPVQSEPIATKVVSENPRSWWGVLDTTICDKVCQCLATGRWFSMGTLVSSINKTDHHNITEILLKVALNTIDQTYWQTNAFEYFISKNLHALKYLLHY